MSRSSKPSVTPGFKFEGQKQGDTNGSIGNRHERFDPYVCMRQIEWVSKYQRVLEIELVQVLVRRGEILILDSFTELIQSGFADVAVTLDRFNPDRINGEMEYHRQGLLEDLATKIDAVMDVRGEIGWMRKMLEDAETRIKYLTRDCGAVYSCLTEKMRKNGHGSRDNTNFGEPTTNR